LLTKTWYWVLRSRAADASGYVANVGGPVAGTGRHRSKGDQERVQRDGRAAGNSLRPCRSRFFYSFLGIPIAAWADPLEPAQRSLAWVSARLWKRRPTGACGPGDQTSACCSAARGDDGRVGEAGGRPAITFPTSPDYFPKLQTGARRFSIYALAGGRSGTAVGREDRRLGAPSTSAGARRSISSGSQASPFALLVGVPDGSSRRPARLRRTLARRRSTGQAGGVARGPQGAPPNPRSADVHVPPPRRSFISVWAAGLNSVVWYASGAFTTRSSSARTACRASQAGQLGFPSSSIVGAWARLPAGFSGGNWLSKRRNDRTLVSVGGPASRRWLCVPFQFGAYLSGDMSLVLPMFGAMQFMAAVFFSRTSFAMTQAIADFGGCARVATLAYCCCCKRLIGQGIGPWLAGYISDELKSSMGTGVARLFTRHRPAW